MGKGKGSFHSDFLSAMRQKSKAGTLRSVWKDWLWIWSFSRRRWVSVMLYTVCGILSSGMALAAGVISKYMIDAIVYFQLERLVLYCVLLVVSAAASVAFRSFTSQFSARLNVNMQNDVQAKVFDDIMASDWMSLSKYSTGDLLSRFSSDVSTIANCAVSWLPSVIIEGFTVLATLCVILYYDPIMALIGCASTPLLFLMSRRLMLKQRSHNMKMREVYSDMASFQSETFHNMDTLKSFGVEDQASQKLRFWQKIYRKTLLDYNRFTIRTNVWLTAMGSLVQYGALAYCLWRLWRGDILFGTMTLFLQQRASLSSAFSSLISLVPTALSGSVAAERIQELTQLPREPRHQPVQVQGCCSIHMEQVRVSYQDDRKVLEDVDLFVPGGKIVALVGPSGEGKTTLLRLLLGLIRPDQGSVYLKDSSGREYALGADTRTCISYVPQGNTMIAGTVAENLRLAREDASEEQMRQALEDACAWEFVKDLPQQMDTPIGEGGKGLSEGQAQRIAIARALLRNAPVLLLDEVTSALDLSTEQRVLDRLTRRGVTTVVTTHRPSVLSQSIHAYRVENGQVRLLRQEELNGMAQKQ